jgi:hypothetical protein
MSGAFWNVSRPGGMGAALAGLTLLLVGSLWAAPKKPPSSLHKLSAIVRFSHSHERIAGCQPRVDGHACVEQRVPAAAGVDFTLTPEPEQLVSEPSAQRQPVNVSLPKRPGSSTLEVRVESGNWILSWADQRTPFHVEAQRDFSAQLTTLSGACVEEQAQCLRHDDVTSRKITMPSELLGAR